MKLLGMDHKEQTKSYYTDRHETAKNIEYCLEFCRWYMEEELETHRWVQLSEDEADRVYADYSDVNRQIITKTSYNFKDKNGNRMVEVHVDSDNHGRLEPFIQASNRHLGGNRSVRSTRTKPLMLWGHDECALHQFTFSKRSWHVDGACQLLPKSSGVALMVSGLQCRELGLGFKGLLTDEVLAKINRNRENQHYLSPSSALLIHGNTKK